MVKTYDLDEIVRTLNQVLPYDWRGFFGERVYNVNKRAPLGGITSGGWKLVYNETPNVQMLLEENIYNFTNLSYSIGIFVNKEGMITDVNPDLTAAKAGLAPSLLTKMPIE